MKWAKLSLVCCLALALFSCGTKLDENLAHGVMKKIYEARKKGSFYKEFRYYDKESFKIVPFNDVAITLKTVVGSAGRFEKANHLSTKVVRRNQISEGLISYMVITYEVEYARLSLTESYYFLASSEKPSLVYMTLQF
jgi:hypothetical protein